MSSWVGVNVSTITATSSAASNHPNRLNRSDHGDQSTITTQQQHQNPHNSSNSNANDQTETIEATLNRFIKSYHIAMECVNAFHLYDKEIYSKYNAGDEEKQQQQQRQQQQSDDKKEHIQQLLRVGRAARNTFEWSILSDPLIANAYALNWMNCKERNRNINNGIASNHPTNAIQEVFTSASHRDTIQQIAYLSLVNYADLLIMGLLSSPELEQQQSLSSFSSSAQQSFVPTKNILDKGIVKSIRSSKIIVQQHHNQKSMSASHVTDHYDTPASCWIVESMNRSTNPASDDTTMGLYATDDNTNDSHTTQTEYERIEDTTRLALVAYMDATVIDGSDPILWMKLACSARRLNRILLVLQQQQQVRQTRQPPNVSLSNLVWHSKYRRLERYALEKATLAAIDPPNRTAQRALQEWWEEEHNCTIIDDDDDETTTTSAVPSLTSRVTTSEQNVVLELSRYSWSTFGRMLLRVCKEGSLSNATSIQGHHMTVHANSSMFSPNVYIQVSPMLAVPTSLLSNIVSYLPSTEIWRIESTCRALSASMISVRVKLNKNTNSKAKSALTNTFSSSSDLMVDPSAVPQSAITIPSEDTEQTLIITDKAAQDTEPNTARTSVSSTEPLKRKSSRVRSQILSSGKRNERSNRRNSIEYCFLASVLGCTTDDPMYEKLVQLSIQQEQPRTTNSNDATNSDNILPAVSNNTAVSTKRRSCNTHDPSDQLHESSLYSFIKYFTSSSNSIKYTPLACLFRFVAHASIHTTPVFTADVGIFDMHTILLDCLEWMYDRTSLRTEIISCWSVNRHCVPNNASLDAIEMFAIDVLHAELRLRRCEFEGQDHFDFDSDENFTATMMPSLREVIDEIDVQAGALKGSKGLQWKHLKARYYWLSACWYFWRGRQSPNVTESRQADEAGILLIEETKKCIPESAPVLTPHLSSPMRKGQHWKELSVQSLTIFADEAQASAVVLQAQEQFLEVSRGGSHIIETESCDALKKIGEVLIQRYASTDENSFSKCLEIIDNFCNVHSEILTTLQEDCLLSWILSVVPSTMIEQGKEYEFPVSPSILTILVTCLRTDKKYATTIVFLLVRLVLCILDLAENLLTRQNIQWEKKYRSPVIDEILSDYESDIDDEDLPINDDDDQPSGKQHLNTDDMKLQRYSTLIRLFMQRILSFCNETLTPEDHHTFVNSDELATLISRTLSYGAELHSAPRPLIEPQRTGLCFEDLGIFRSVQDLFRYAESKYTRSTPSEVRLKQVYVEGIFQIVLMQRRLFSFLSQFRPRKIGKTIRVRATRKRAELIAETSFDLGLILSTNLASLEVDQIKRFAIFSEVNSNLIQKTRFVGFCDSILWFWKVAFSTEKGSSTAPYLSAYLDDFGRDRLRVPVATAIVGLCGSALSENPSLSELVQELATLSEFYDSDASAAAFSDDSDGESEAVHGKVEAGLRRAIIHAVHCVSIAFGRVDEKEASSYSFLDNYISSNGPGLPLVVSRVLNSFANRLLLGFKGNDIGENGGLWGDYRFGLRSVGLLLDSMLWKAYKCLHGFILTNETKDSAGGTGGSAGNAKTGQIFPPENNTATAMLFRCIMRTYSHGRRSAPKAALELVLSALPNLQESEKGSAIRRYLFTPTTSDNDYEKLLSMALQRQEWESSFSNIEGFDWLESVNSDSCDDEISLVRRGLSQLIAHGPLPRLQDNGEEKDWRTTSSQSEEDLSVKFSAILDDLCFGAGSDWEGWFKASQCLNMKSDLVADRLGLSKGFNRNPKFVVSQRQRTLEQEYNIDELIALQNREETHHNSCWVQTLGKDLSIYIRYNWTSFDDLKKCFHEMERFYRIEYDMKNPDGKILDAWGEICSLYSSGDHARWQLAWGGLFVSSLRQVAYRCMGLALYFSNKNCSRSGNKLLQSELIETLGVNFYVELMGSQCYGFPMKVMPVSVKRRFATHSRACFERASTLLRSEEDESKEKIEAWDLLFMLGKCHEKIASTYEKEAYDSPNRKYEKCMSMALQTYAKSLENATILKKDGGFIGEHHGGSSHGLLEVFYRLHATRLKCLISAVDKSDDFRDLAELEALRLTESHWYQSPENDGSNLPLRQRVWRVLEDIVGALAKCSLDNSYFHRSVYRHAQALMWAPILYDPNGERVNGSLGNVPATWACKIRGLNSSTNAASSALSIINTLFTKKRPQLVAVWVTVDGESTPFQMINSFARKYDSLRGKYIAAYIDSLRMCLRRKELDIFLTWTTTCVRDLPSHFAASALAEGGMPAQSSILENLVVHDRSIISLHFLNTVRRSANSALSKVILDEMNEFLQKSTPTKHSEKGKYFETQLKLTYACFLRLNCDLETLTKTKSWMYQKHSGILDVIEALTVAYTNVNKEDTSSSTLPNDRLDWSGESHMMSTLIAAVHKCKELYPSLSRNFSFTRQRAPSQQKSKNESINVALKRKISPNHEKKSFEVDIPNGLKEGDTFLSSITVGEVVKRIRLTVPSGTASTLRFSLEVPIDLDSSNHMKDSGQPSNL